MNMVKTIADGAVMNAGVPGLCAGANLRTPCGERRVEFLRKGDLVVTRDNGLQPVVMIWTRVITAADMAADPAFAPVLLAPRAIAPMMPSKPLQVGGAQRLLIPGWRIEEEEDGENCLVAARDVEGLELGSAPGPDDVTYYNVVFETPQVFCANGMPVESFTPSAQALKTLPRQVRQELQRSFPNLAPHFDDYPAPAYKRRKRVSYIPNFV